MVAAVKDVADVLTGLTTTSNDYNLTTTPIYTLPPTMLSSREIQIVVKLVLQVSFKVCGRQLLNLRVLRKV
ncbi:hypothetical protein Hdeb2414_s0558g00916441 [Helianthus debilis subsp. tardiflorus]